MTVFEIEETKRFMQCLLKEELFDDFRLLQLDLKTFVHFSVDGKGIETEDPFPFVPWLQVKPAIVRLVQGSKPPGYLKVVFAVSPEATASILEKSGKELSESIQGFTLTILYENGQLRITTGTNYRTFVSDKTGERVFDQSMRRFLQKNALAAFPPEAP
ncbi:DUF5721 family protein [Anaerotalea alkaliphila]|uniref:Uncharacterized protein n=1 Tax=Anaerotalea alkaliphila TaxID=2662126 RepID=A0A7X5HXB6_9FIRM|nr:DUF5721 family protein [Anaerotalea alkaliphila]NDL68331.1 hypothetical protein [Anaerotalea alkaliphila]